MQILWLNHRDLRHPRGAGAERTIFEVGRRLAERGHRVRWVSSAWPGAPVHDSLAGIEVSRYAGPLLPHAAGALLLRSARPPDVVVDDLAHVVPWCSPWWAATPTVVFFRHLHARTLPGQVRGPLAAVLTRVERSYSRLYRRAPFVTESQQSQTDLEALGIASDRCWRIPPGVDSQVLRPGTLDAIPSFVFFAGLRPYKRPEDAVRAFALYRRSGLPGTLSVVGAGPSLERVRELTRTEQLDTDVRFMGRMSAEALAELLSHAWVNINCSVAEGWGYSTLEAASCGVPTVAYDVPGVRETVLEGKTGVLVPDGDVAQLASGLRLLTESRPTWTARCRGYAESFSWEECASRWEEVLTRAAA